MFFIKDKNLEKVFKCRNSMNALLGVLSQGYKFQLTFLFEINSTAHLNSKVWAQYYNILNKNLEILFLEFQKLTFRIV